MSNKPWSKVNELDRLIRQTLRLGMDQGTFLKIEFIYGFEKFNTRPYHNYETWSGGYRVSDPRTGIVVEREDLDDALGLWAKQVACVHDWSEKAMHCRKGCGAHESVGRLRIQRDSAEGLSGEGPRGDQCGSPST